MIKTTQISFDANLDYLITVQGSINEGFYELLGNIKKIAQVESDAGKSVIQIAVKDQSHLNGILNTLFNARYVILNVECIE